MSGSHVCDFPNCFEILIYNDKPTFVPSRNLYFTCFCRSCTLTLRICIWKKHNPQIICSKCIADSIRKDYEYIRHTGSGSSLGIDVLLKIDDYTYLEHSNGGYLSQPDGSRWYLYKKVDRHIFEAQRIYDLKPYTFIPLVEYVMRNTKNNYINVIPKDIIGVISTYLFYTISSNQK